MTAYPEPEFTIGHVVYNRFDEPLTVVAQRRTDQIMALGGHRLFSDEDAKRTPWFYTLRTSNGEKHSTSGHGLRYMEQMTAGRRAPAEADHPIPPTQRGRLNVGEPLRDPRGTWVVTESWIANKAGAQGKDRTYGPAVFGDNHMYYLLTHEDGHQEEWSAPDMADADFHRILPNEQQTLI